MADTICLHGYTVQNISLLHGAPLVRNDNQLSGLFELLNGIKQLGEVGVVERGLNLIKNVERNSTRSVYSKEQCQGGEALLAT